MKHPLTILLLALTCATLHAQSVSVQASSAGNVRGTGAGNVRAISATYCSGRFMVNFDNTNVAVDNDSGLTWMRNASIGGYINWTNAIAYCSNLTYAGYSDWRLPSIAEISKDESEGGTTNGLADAPVSANDPALPLGHPFTSVHSAFYWSSTTNAGDTNGAWKVSLVNGAALSDFKDGPGYVWPCRGP